MRYAVIIAGGTGTRLWPMSRQDRPKQLMKLFERDVARSPGERVSLLEIAADRLGGLIPHERVFVCTGERYRDAVKEALPWIDDERVLGEPVGRDTVNAVGLAAAVFEKMDPDASFIVLTADHLIRPESVFRERADLAFRLVEQDRKRLVTFSIKPTYAATGYGYVERGAALTGAPGGAGEADPLCFRVSRFVEKPDLHRAQAYFESGHFGWNSGMFVYHAATFMECLSRFKPESHGGLRKIQEAWGTADQGHVLEETYPSLPKIAVDFAVMEPASRDRGVTLCTVMLEVSWLDVGSWPSFGETLVPDRAGNRVGGGGRAMIVDGKGNLVVGDDPGHTVALLGCENLIVVHTADATLVMPRDKAEDLKKLYTALDDPLR